GEKYFDFFGGDVDIFGNFFYLFEFIGDVGGGGGGGGSDGNGAGFHIRFFID
ncbi:unnamed protein product, partial [Rotaria sp. Silwood2]